MLFSEPKIPQCDCNRCALSSSTCFSALQRAENSSIHAAEGEPLARHQFQCSSASRKFLNFPSITSSNHPSSCFSALQRAENSSIPGTVLPYLKSPEFQCSSASRKFLNLHSLGSYHSSDFVSVLFSEPKIPQFFVMFVRDGSTKRFSALQRAENSSIQRRQRLAARVARFSALQRAENSSIFDALRAGVSHSGFSALQRAENSSIDGSTAGYVTTYAFQCSSASRKFLNCGIV